METIAKINYNSEVFRIEGDVWERGRMGEGAHGGQNWTRRHGDAGCYLARPFDAEMRRHGDTGNNRNIKAATERLGEKDKYCTIRYHSRHSGRGCAAIRNPWIPAFAGMTEDGAGKPDYF